MFVVVIDNMGHELVVSREGHEIQFEDPERIQLPFGLFHIRLSVGMTAVATFIGLFPIRWNTGTGTDVMKHHAALMVGGMISTTVLTLLLVPAIYFTGSRVKLSKEVQQP